MQWQTAVIGVAADRNVQGEAGGADAGPVIYAVVNADG